MNVLWALALVAAALYSVWSALRGASTLDITAKESGDIAGDALQVRKALEEGWFATGHHTDVGVSHPGPFGLWMRAVAESLHARGLGATPLAAVVAAYMVLRIAILFGAGALVAQALRSRLAGAAFSITAAGVITGFDGRPPAIPLLHFLSPYPVVLLLAAGLAWARGVRWSLLWLSLSAGMVSHLHTPSMPLGVLGLAVAGIGIFRARNTLHARIAGAVWILFSAPLMARIFLEPGFPFNYLEASAARIASRKANPEPYVRFQFLGEELGTSGKMVFVILCLAAVLLLGLAWNSRYRRVALTLAVPTVYAVIVIATSYPHQSFASELLWIPGLWVFGCGLLLAVAVSAAVRFAGSLVDSTAGIMALLPASGVCIGLFGAPMNLWFDTSMVPAVTDAVVAYGLTDSGNGVDAEGDSENSPGGKGGSLIALAVESSSWMTSVGVVLELQRLNVPHCVEPVIDTGMTRDVLETFLPESMFCDPTKDHRVLVLTNGSHGSYGTTIYTYQPDQTGEDDGMLRPSLLVQELTCGQDPRLSLLAGCGAL